MGRVRVCGARCHNAKGDRCKCWCGGYFHGVKSASNRASFREAIINHFSEQKEQFKRKEIKYKPDVKLMQTGLLSRCGGFDE